ISKVECTLKESSGGGGSSGIGAGGDARIVDMGKETTKEAIQHNTKKELSNILEKMQFKWDKEGITLPETHELYFVAKEKYLSSNEEAKTQKAKLELLKEGCDEVLSAFDSHFKKELITYQGKPYSIHRSEAEEKVRRIRNLIQNYPK
ncbi:18394_t:CDS:2, partial [Funneliformis geosporum]